MDGHIYGWKIWYADGSSFACSNAGCPDRELLEALPRSGVQVLRIWLHKEGSMRSILHSGPDEYLVPGLHYYLMGTLLGEIDQSEEYNRIYNEAITDKWRPDTS